MATSVNTRTESSVPAVQHELERMSADKHKLMQLGRRLAERIRRGEARLLRTPE